MGKQEVINPAHDTIAKALVAAQGEMESAKKTATNPHFKKKYADLEAVCQAVIPALNKHGIAVVQPLEKFGDHWLVITRFLHSGSDDTLETPVPILLERQDMQKLGSAITYARRYGLMALSGIAPEDDDGNASVNHGSRKAVTVSPDQFVRLRDLAAQAGVNAERICETYGAASLEQFPQDHFESAVKKLNATIEAKPKAEEPAASEKILDDQIPY